MTASICIPARNEASTIGLMVERIRRELVDTDVIQEVVVIDDCSSDRTGDIASRAGARLVRTEESISPHGVSSGKGDAIWASIAACRTDLIGWIDGDLTAFDPLRIGAMFCALRVDPRVQLVKGSFDRMKPDGTITEGRLTALTARPLLHHFYPELARLREPLGGIFAMRTEVAADLELDPDYGVDIGIVIDVFERFGVDAITEIYMGTLSHCSRSLEALSDSALMVSRAILTRGNFSRGLRMVHSDVEPTNIRRIPVRYSSGGDLAVLS